MKLTSPVFDSYKAIPSKYTCEGLNCNPELHIDEVPLDAKSLVLIVEDPDVPKYLRSDGLWDHWIVFNIPPRTTIIKENCSSLGVYGRSTSGNLGYEGPCPPDKKHRYFFKLYAIDTILGFTEGVSKDEVIKAIGGHVIDAAELVGTYEKHHLGEN